MIRKETLYQVTITNQEVWWRNNFSQNLKSLARVAKFLRDFRSQRATDIDKRSRDIMQADS